MSLSFCISDAKISYILLLLDLIYGYKDLKIDIYVTSASLEMFIKYEYSDKTEDPDNFFLSFDQYYYGGYTRDAKQFAQRLQD